MAINTALLVVDSTIQDYLVDKTTGEPLVNGVITFYRDNSRTTLKNIYYQSGVSGAYTYLTLPNPLTLSGVGTVVDNNGNDTKILYYPYDELDNVTPQPYYLTIDDQNGLRQFTRSNWPINSTSGSITPSVTSATLRNLITNNVFWRNQGTVSLTNTQQYVLCPSQHDGFSYPDMQFLKDANGATDTVTFTTFSSDRLTNDVTPEFYMNVACGNSGSSETYKIIQIPICLHVDNLSGQTNCSVTLWTQNVGGSANNQLAVKLYQFLGTGVTPSTPVTLETITVSSSWTKSVITFNFPTATLPPSGPGDDAWYLQLSFPLGKQFNMNIAKPSVYLSTSVPSDDFDTYDEVDSVINTPRTGDVRTSLNTFYPYGWVAMNGGTIGNASSNATSRANTDTWPLFNLLWQAFNAYTVSTTNLLAQMVTSAGANVAYGASAIADWNANRAITLTSTMGKVILGTAPVSALIAAYQTTFTASSSGGLLITTANNVNYFNGMPFYVSNSGGSLPTGLSANTIYYVANFNGASTFNVATTFANAMAGTVVSYTNGGSGTHTVTAELAGTSEGEYAHTQLSAELAAHTHALGASSTISSGAGGTVYSAAAGGATGNRPTLTSGNNLSDIWSAGGTTNSTGSGTPFNVTQPGTFFNIYMKL